MNVKVKTASGFLLLVFRLFGFYGWASAWGVIYIAPGHENNQILIRHETCHIEQIKRDGWYWQPIKYAWYLFVYGYKNNPYEVEAREAEKNG